MVSDRELIEQSRRLLTRLGRHLDALEGGDASAGDDLAAVLRILIDANGKGNRAILRLAAAANLDLPRVWVSGSPARVNAAHLLVSFGNLPVSGGSQELGQDHAPHWMGFRAWIESPSLLVPLSQRRRESWSTFATLAGNTSGAHLSEVTHDLLATSSLFRSSGLSLQNYFLRQVGWQVEQVLANLLIQARQFIAPITRRVDHWPRQVVWGWFTDEVGVALEANLAVVVSDDDAPPTEVMRYTVRGRTSRIVHSGHQVQLLDGDHKQSIVAPAYRPLQRLRLSDWMFPPPSGQRGPGGQPFG